MQSRLLGYPRDGRATSAGEAREKSRIREIYFSSVSDSLLSMSIANHRVCDAANGDST